MPTPEGSFRPPITTIHLEAGRKIRSIAGTLEAISKLTIIEARQIGNQINQAIIESGISPFAAKAKGRKGANKDTQRKTDQSTGIVRRVITPGSNDIISDEWPLGLDRDQDLLWAIKGLAGDVITGFIEPSEFQSEASASLIEHGYDKPDKKWIENFLPKLTHEMTEGGWKQSDINLFFDLMDLPVRLHADGSIK